MGESFEMSVYRIAFWLHMRVEDMKKFAVNLIIKLLPKEAKEMIQKVWAFLNGKKTYLFMVSIIAQALVEYAADQDLGKLITTILLALGGAGSRAVAKPEEK